MTKYESPTMKFESLTLFEKIADVCWATTHVTYDNPNDGYAPTTVEPEILSAVNGCDNRSDKILDWLKGYFSNQNLTWESLGTVPQDANSTPASGFTFPKKS